MLLGPAMQQLLDPMLGAARERSSSSSVSKMTSKSWLETRERQTTHIESSRDGSAEAHPSALQGKSSRDGSADAVRLWTGLDWTGLDRTRLDSTGLDWTGLDCTGLDWNVCPCHLTYDI